MAESKAPHTASLDGPGDGSDRAAFTITPSGDASGINSKSLSANLSMESKQASFRHGIHIEFVAGRGRRACRTNRRSRLAATLARRPIARAAPSRLAIVDRSGWSGRRFGWNVDRHRRMAVRARGHGAIRTDLSLVGDDQHRPASVRQPDDDALHALLRRADRRRRHAHVARAARLDLHVWRARFDRRYLALQRGRRRRSVGRGHPGPFAGQRHRHGVRLRDDRGKRRSSCAIWGSASSCWRSCR